MTRCPPECTCRGRLSAMDHGRKAWAIAFGTVRPMNRAAARLGHSVGLSIAGALSKLPGLLFEAPTDALGRINLWCSRIAAVAVGGILAIWILTEVL